MEKIKKYFFEKFFRGDLKKVFLTEDPYMQPILGPFFGPKSPLKIIFDDFHDQGMKVWVQAVLGSVFGAAPSPDFYFLWVSWGSESVESCG